MEDHTFDLEDHHDTSHHEHVHVNNHEDDAAEAVLASLRAVINDPNSHTNDHQHDHSMIVDAEGEEELLEDDHDDVTNVHTPVISQQDNSNHAEQTLQEFVHQQQQQQEQPSTVEGNDPSTHTQIPSLITSILEKGLQSLQQQISSNQHILTELNSPNAIQNLVSNLKSLTEGNKKELEIIRNLNDQIKAFNQVEDGNQTHNLLSAFTSNSDSELSPFVLRSEYDSLKSRYDELVASGSDNRSNKRDRRSKANKQSQSEQNQTLKTTEDQLQPLTDAVNETIAAGIVAGNQLGGIEGRKKRSIKLEHLVHKMANRRLGVEYLVTNFESKGTKELPDPKSQPIKAENSINGVDELRPDFKSDLNHFTVKPFIDQVIEDCKEGWKGDLAVNEPDIDDERITTAVQIYWTRLCKRYDEQLHRERGEIHRDELSRRKQNSYRRQQSLLARRLAAFDSSPLNVCKLRALYRTLLTIDFAAPTQDSPDSNRAYTEEEWKAYRKLACGSRAPEAHEVIDQFWLSSMARQLLIILDVYSADMNSRARKKGKPKQPNPTFHLPRHLWDTSTLPIIRPKDENGLPLNDKPGIVLFKFHVDEKIQKENPEWSKGLYENPPIPNEDLNLSSLNEVMSMGIYISLKPQLKIAKDKSNPKVLTPEEIQEINNRLDESDNSNSIEVGQSILEATSTLDNNIHPDLISGNVENTASNSNNTGANDETDYTTLLALNRLDGLSTNLDVDVSTSNSSTSPIPNSNLPSTPSTSVINNQRIAELTNPFTISTTNPLSGLSGIIEHSIGPSPGSSMRARKLGKRSVSEVPGGAATPVPINKKRKSNLSLMRDNNNESLVNLSSIGLSDNQANLSIEENDFINGTSGVDSGNTLDDMANHNSLVVDQHDEEDEEDLEDKLVNGEVQGDAAFLDNL